MAKKVLLCDDEVHILRAAEFKLSRAGYEVRCACDGEQAWQEIERDRPDVVVTDLQMPRLNGLGLARRVRETVATRDLPVIMLTAKGYELARDRVIDEMRFVTLLTKPFSPRELLEVVDRALAEPCDRAGDRRADEEPATTAAAEERRP